MPLRVYRFYGQPYKEQQLNHPKTLKVLTGRSSHDCKLTETFSFPGSTFYSSRHRHNRHWANLVPRAFPGTRLAWGLSLIQSNMYIGSLNFIRFLRVVTSRFFESEPNDIYSHVSEKGQKAGFLRQKPRESQYRGKRKGEKERARRTKGKEEKKRNGCTLRFIMATLESFWPKKLFDERSLFGSNVFKHPARYKVR